MGGLIEGAKRKIWSIATAIVDSNRKLLGFSSLRG
jgi:hypothetical protein